MRRYGKTYDKFVFGFEKCKIAPETANFKRSEATKIYLVKSASYIAHKCLSAIRQLHELIAQRRRDKRPVF